MAVSPFDLPGSSAPPSWATAGRAGRPSSIHSILLKYNVFRSAEDVQCHRAICCPSLYFLLASLTVHAQTPELSKAVQEFVRVNSGKTVLTHVRIIDGTGAAAVDDQNLVIENGKITAITKGADVAADKSTAVLDLHGHTVMPGIVGMHDHLFYIVRPNLDSRRHFDNPVLVTQMTFSAPRLYLAGGVTTMRTTGSVEPYADLNLKRDIDAGKLPGPHMDVSGPYLEGAESYFIQMPHLTGPDDARQTVEYWADRGVTSFKAYMNITRAELKRRSMRRTSAASKSPAICARSLTRKRPSSASMISNTASSSTRSWIPARNQTSAVKARAMKLLPAWIRIVRGERPDQFAGQPSVAITTTPPVFEGDLGGGRPPLRQQALDATSPQAREDFFLLRQPRPASAPAPKVDPATLWKHDLELEPAFAAAGGLLLAGPDPTGRGDVLPGFGDQREVELLVEAGFSPVEAIKVATLNGAVYLGRDKQIGSIAAEKNADLVVIKGDPSKQISDVENVKFVFKDGVGYDSRKLLDSVRGRYGQY